MRFLLLVSPMFFIFSACNTNISRVVQVVPDPIQLAMDEQATVAIEDSVFSALSIGIIHNGKTYSGHYGELDPGQNNPPTDETVYEIASLTKTFTGTLVAQAVLDGKLQLEDDIRQFLIGDYPNLEFEGEPIRIKHLLSHTSRLPRNIPQSIDALFSNINETLPERIEAVWQGYSRDQYFIDLAKIEIDTQPGIIYQYANSDTELMGHILEQVYDKTYQELLDQFISQPYGLISTKMHLTGNDHLKLANGYGINNYPTPYFSIPLWGTGGGLKSTVADLLNYMAFQLDTTNTLAMKSHQTIYEGEDETLAYFWPVNEDEEDGRYLSHHGGAYGMQNWMFIVPKHNLGIAVIANQSTPSTAGELVDVLINILDKIR